MKLKNKVAIITGWAKWIWKAIVLDLLKSWAKVVINYFWDDKNAKNFELELKNFDWNFVFVKADIAKTSEVDKIFDKAKNSFWMVDILINNAGIFDTWLKDTIEQFKKMFDVNFFSHVYATELFEKQFSWELWKIVNIWSIFGVNPFPVTWWTRNPAYLCSKVVVDMFSKICAKNFDWKILVNTVSPGSVETPMWEWADENFKKIRAEEPMIKRFIKPEEISDAVIFLLKNDAMNWENIIVDWGNILK